MLVMSFMTETQIVHINEHGEMTGLETFGDFIFYTPTLYAANMGDRWLIQVTDEQVQLLDLQHGQRCSQWIPPRGKHITLASASQTQVVVTLPGGKLIYLEIEDQQLVEKGQV
jgi:splicing factor 3B subunit 3